MKLKSLSVLGTHELGRLLFSFFPEYRIFGLSGPLGAGKTEFVRGVAELFGINEKSGIEVASPTFVIESIYNLKSSGPLKTLSHWDLYRLGESYVESELWDYLEDKSRLVFIEWPERVTWVQDLLSAKITIDFPASESEGISEALGRPVNAPIESERLFTIEGLPEAQLESAYRVGKFKDLVRI